jgi:AcrR family transcriptional regulator
MVGDDMHDGEREAAGLPEASGSEEAGATQYVDQSGRPLGPRALQTRQRILETTVELLEEKAMRDLRVIDIARRIGTSPATFYQYFKDVEDVVLHLATEASEQTPQIVELIEGDWRGRAGHERARCLADLVIQHWERYAPILRVRNNASDEGDDRFRRVRLRAMMPIVYAFENAIRRAHDEAEESEEAAKKQADHSAETTPAEEEEWRGGRVDPTAGATALTSLLERLAMYHAAIKQLGGSREDLVETAATMIQATLTSRH